MRKILLINGGKSQGESGGRLSLLLHNLAKNYLSKLGYALEETHIDLGYDISVEIKKLVDSDIWIYQMPAWWMGEPWIVKRYIDEIFGLTELFDSDGRSRADSSKNYGKGGKAQNKRYMFSVTWNAPYEAFSNPEEFFEGRGVEAVYWHLHKAHEFLGMSSIPTFMCNDVIKNPQVEQYQENYKEHLRKYFA